MSLMLKPLWHSAPTTSYTFTSVSLNCWSSARWEHPSGCCVCSLGKNQTWNQFSFCCDSAEKNHSTDGVSTVLGRGSNRGEEQQPCGNDERRLSAQFGSWQRELHLELCYRQNCAETITTRLPAPWVHLFFPVSVCFSSQLLVYAQLSLGPVVWFCWRVSWHHCPAAVWPILGQAFVFRQAASHLTSECPNNPTSPPRSPPCLTVRLIGHVWFVALWVGASQLWSCGPQGNSFLSFFLNRREALL